MPHPEVHTVLLIPGTDDPHKLLAEGVCESRPPAMWWGVPRALIKHQGSAWREGHPLHDDHLRGGRGLVLARDGKLVPEGIDRAVRRGVVQTPRLLENWLRFQLKDASLQEGAFMMAPGKWAGAIVLLDAEDRAIPPCI